MRTYTKLTQIKNIIKPSLNLGGKDLIPDYSIKFIPRQDMTEYTKLRTMAIEDEFMRTELGKDTDRQQALNYQKPKPRPIQNTKIKSQMIACRGDIYLRWKQNANLVEFKVQ
ncbi:hypothetical protein SS50377_26959 [Spironucleus salmonicida]|uniref:Uncharacterized protein n=1 Tax=Spironucleus salmonicida TaxID=348837 RepID=V6LSB2_9EUKA|nr:hypothetical protein SS50377_26959 [Spironucleus salmonicida]|eukprot:EST47470.1 Hypothetical protein SS50377_12455 [Spironucleus salmonicida]